jgi:4-methylaminobutanoate oxidase (formaldehyde-forming)
VKLRGNVDFLGRAALEAKGPLTKRLAGFTTSPDVVLVGRETILRNGEPVGYLTSGGYGYTLGRSIGYGYVRNPEGVSDAHLASGRYELIVAGDSVPAEIGLKPFYDPEGLRIRG